MKITKWTPAEVDKMCAMRDEGASHAEISRAIGRTRDAITGKIRELKLGPPKVTNRGGRPKFGKSTFEYRPPPIYTYRSPRRGRYDQEPRSQRTIDTIAAYPLGCTRRKP